VNPQNRTASFPSAEAGAYRTAEVVPVVVEFEMAVLRSMPACWSGRPSSDDCK
jgi:hypothetical protein